MKNKPIFRKLGELYLTSFANLDRIRINKNIVTIFEAISKGNLRLV
jgi:hypothetical protein